MEKQDKISLTLAYLGCFILTAYLIFGLVPEIIMIPCILCCGFFMIKDRVYWAYHIGKVFNYNKDKLKRITG